MMNYIQHLNTVFNRFYKDEKLHPGHISLYMALFQFWNASRFAKTFPIQRGIVMPCAAIRSKSSYHRYLKDLHQWEYLRYFPSKSPRVGSRVEMIDFSAGTVPSVDQTIPPPDQAVPPARQCSSTMGQQCPINGQDTIYTKTINNNIAIGWNKSPIAEQVVVSFFKQKDRPETEAQKFFNHYQSTGWKIGGQPIENWQAAAQKWMLKADEIKKALKRPVQHDYLKTEKEKNYDQPL
ncbi:hypothetical protein LS482_17220 [Sinomicrobium kalidii]|uniref:hypothetical protein n=1 Tax=Sinomicrobium kalidii TaxID=2900738 RepID=UPI001E5C0C79|nr:hypothetical protein [Sinomicrobium kalidii]UGU15410.1 hypothetical protein LS482_17220 [Sinomicrobium kalidii]